MVLTVIEITLQKTVPSLHVASAGTPMGLEKELLLLHSNALETSLFNT